MGFPKNNPKIIPIPIFVASPSTIPPRNVILVFAIAKMGIIIKLTGVLKKCSNFSSGESLSEVFVGSVIAVNTPAIVA